MFTNQLVVAGDPTELARLELGEPPPAVFSLRKASVSDDDIVFRFDCEREPASEWIVDASVRHPELRFTYEYVDEFGNHGRRVAWIAGAMVDDEWVPPRSLSWVEWEDDEESGS
jgi:hypothetical protein